MIAALLLLLAPAFAADGPEVTRDIGRDGEVVILWPRISPMTEDPQVLQIAAEAQSVLSSLAQSLDKSPNVRPMPQRVCPREKNGCRAPTLSALIAHQDGGCAVIGLVSAAGEVPTEVIGWVGHVQVRERSVPFREAPESIVRIADFAPCDSVLEALPARSDVLTDALRAALVQPESGRMLILLAAIAAAIPRSPCESHPAPTIDMTADLRGQDLRCADLRQIDLRGADLTGTDLTGAWMHQADLRGAILVDANMGFTHLEGADLREADLTDAYMRRSVLRDANLYDATMLGTDLCWVDLTTVEFITAANTVGTQYCRSTLRPDELYRPDDDYDWTFTPFFREPRQNMVTVNSLDGLSLIQYVDARISNNEDEIQLFDDLGTTIGVDVIGAEFVPRFLDASHRHTLSTAGLSLALGFGSGQIDSENFTFVTTNIGPFVRPLSFIQLETGLAVGITLNDAFSNQTDVSVYYGVRVNVRPLVEVLDDLVEVVF